MNRFLAPGNEFSLLEKMFSPEHFRRDGKGLGDDAFLFEPHPNHSGILWAITSDASAEGIHYRLDWVNPEKALSKALLANLSDINAMGGKSLFGFLNLGAGKNWDEKVFEALGHTLQDLEALYGFKISGGDTVRTDGTSFFSFTVIGEIKGRPLLRSACKPGHRIYVSGDLGGSAAGLRILQSEKPSPSLPSRALKDFEKALIEKHLQPNPPLKLGPALSALKKEIAAIDISDGLSSELWHLSRQSGCALQVDWNRLPIHPHLQFCDGMDLHDLVLNGGEEYQLLFTGDFSSEELSQLQTFATLTEIGEVKTGEGVFISEGNATTELSAGGFSHGDSGR